MNYALISIIGLILAIIIGIKRKVNIGIVSLLFAFSLGFFVFGMNPREIYVKGWPIGIFFVMTSSMFMFSFANVNGTMKLLAEKLAYEIKGNIRILPIVFFVVTGIMTACGADPTIVAFILPVAIHIGQKAELNPLVLCVTILAGALTGSSCSPLAVIGIVTSGLALKEGVTNYFSICAATATTMISFSILIYIIFKGWKIKKVIIEDIVKPEAFNVNQKRTLAVILLVVILILFIKMDIAAAAFIGGAIMLILGVASEKEAIKSINWGTLLMVGGTGVLVHVMAAVGGIDLLSELLSSIMDKNTAAPLIAIIAGVMTFVSSATGVVMPALFPTVPGISASLNGSVSTVELMQVIQAGSLGSVSYSPLSALGAVALASLPDYINKDKIFTQLLVIAFSGLGWTILLSFLGIFRLFI
jgi:di/tricarboxylate transporter